MARTKNAKRARVEGECSASARLVASSHYMARWLPSLRALNKYLEKFKSIVIVPPRVILEQLVEQWNLVYHGKKFNGGIAADEEWGQYDRLVNLQKKSIVLSNVAKIDDSVLRPMEKYPDAQEPQVQGQPQDPEVQAQSQESPPPPPPSPTM
ncbi:hypothetical protein AHAS_Ahas13G0222900 [Arachis hypogaea]